MFGWLRALVAPPAPRPSRTVRLFERDGLWYAVLRDGRVGVGRSPLEAVVDAWRRAPRTRPELPT